MLLTEFLVAIVLYQMNKQKEWVESTNRLGKHKIY